MKKIVSLRRAGIWMLMAVLTYLPARAQRFYNNPISQYYRNSYLWNPATAGQEGTRLYGLLNNSWTGFEGAPRQITLAGDMKLGEQGGVGVQLTSDKSGIFQRYSGALSYAYSINFSEDHHFRIGGDLSFYNERIDNSAVTSGGQVDMSGKDFNDKAVRFNGDFGLSYDAGGFTIGATGYNLGSYMQSKDERPADLAVAQVLTSHRFQTGEDKLSITPLVAYKVFYDQPNILTAATQLEYEGVFHASVYWQNTGNIMGGLGLMLKQIGEVNFFYSGKNKYGYNQQYEVGLKCILP